jgi:hypothetical protein
MKSKLAIALLIAALLSIGAWSGYAQTGKQKTVMYQYDVIDDPTVTLGYDKGVKKLNEYGAQGWEIVGVVHVENAYPRLYIKRANK